MLHRKRDKARKTQEKLEDSPVMEEFSAFRIQYYRNETTLSDSGFAPEAQVQLLWRAVGLFSLTAEGVIVLWSASHLFAAGPCVYITAPPLKVMTLYQGTSFMFLCSNRRNASQNLKFVVCLGLIRLEFALYYWI